MSAARHIVLLGDSIFDNAVYVPDGISVMGHLERLLPRDDRATLLAIDGNITIDVLRQVLRVPAGATHLVVSVGGNDALRASGILLQSFIDAEQFLRELTAVQDTFRADYREMLRAVLAQELPMAVCTVYDAIPGMERWELLALSIFNDVIISEAARAGVPVIELRAICTQAEDYAAVSPIEPSTAGGFKIAKAVAGLIDRHDFTQRRAAIYVD